MIGVIVNVIAIIIGALMGFKLKNVLPKRLIRGIEIGLGIWILYLGVKMALQFESMWIFIACLVGGGIIGTLLRVEDRTHRVASNIQNRYFKQAQGTFSLGFITASILYCTGAMAVVGSINSGTIGDHEVLFAKAIIDGICSVTFSAIYGLGVAFSAIPVLIYQGTIAMLASQLEVFSIPQVINEISGVSGVLLMMIGFNFLGLRKIAVGNYLPALPMVVCIACYLA